MPMKSHDIVILHGWNLSGKRFDPLAKELTKKGYRVFAPDFPGFGSEPSPKTPWHVTDYAQFLERYITAHKLRKPTLIGHSFGGRVALVYAAAHADQITNVVLTGTPGFSPVPKKKMVIFLIIAKIGGLLFRIPGINLFADAARKLLYRAAGAHEFYRAEGAMRQTFKNIVQDNLEQSMSTLAVPCLLIWGEGDTIVPPAVSRRMHALIPNSTLTVVDGETHAFPFEDPKRFISAMKNFL